VGALEGLVVSVEETVVTLEVFLVLAEVVAAAELLATVGTLEGLVVRLKRAVVAFEVLLATKAVRAESADKGLGRVLSQRRLASIAAGRGEQAQDEEGDAAALLETH
jgi:uncharacterized membrane protein YphA (DoxX/SURF4 family)